MPVTNGSFEEGSVADPGVPLGWTIHAATSLRRVAAFGVPARGIEAFGWAATLDDLVAEPLAVAQFDTLPEVREDFEEGWSNDDFYTALHAVEIATFDGDPDEAFSWTTLLGSLAVVEVEAAELGDPDNEELFGPAGWLVDDEYFDDWSDIGGDVACRMFDGLLEERFETDWTEIGSL